MNQLSQKLTSCFSDEQGIIAVFLFGSYAVNKQNPTSDIDIGIILDAETIAPEQYSQIRNRFLVKLSRTLRKEIHLVILNTAGEGLLDQVLRKGICIMKNDQKKLSLFYAQMMLRIFDFSYHKNIMQTGFVKNLLPESCTGRRHSQARRPKG